LVAGGWDFRFRVSFGVQSEQVLDRAMEDLSEGECEGKRWDIAIALDGVDALTGDAGEGREVLLGPVAGLAEFAEAVVEGGHGKSA